MEWSSLRTQIRRTLEESSAGVWSDDSLLFWVNRAAEDFGRKTKMLRDEQYTTTIVGTPGYDPPERTLEVIDLYYENERLYREDSRDISDLDHTEESGTPKSYWVTLDTVILYPVPDSTGELRFFRYYLPDEMTDDTDTVPYSGYEGALEFYTLSRAFDQIGDWQASGEFMARYDRTLEQAVAQASIERQVTRVTSAPREVW